MRFRIRNAPPGREKRPRAGVARKLYGRAEEYCETLPPLNFPARHTPYTFPNPSCKHTQATKTLKFEPFSLKGAIRLAISLPVQSYIRSFSYLLSFSFIFFSSCFRRTTHTVCLWKSGNREKCAILPFTTHVGRPLYARLCRSVAVRGHLAEAATGVERIAVVVKKKHANILRRLCIAGAATSSPPRNALFKCSSRIIQYAASQCIRRDRAPQSSVF